MATGTDTTIVRADRPDAVPVVAVGTGDEPQVRVSRQGL